MSVYPRVRDVNCPFCAAEQTENCTTAAGRETDPHRLRWDERSSKIRNSEFIVQITEDDPRLGLTAGEEYAAICYWLDPGCKVTLLRRVTDGWDPECNLYSHQGEFVRWAANP